jgi:hypothetical protein
VRKPRCQWHGMLVLSLAILLGLLSITGSACAQKADHETRASGRVFNVKRFGAVGDGIADDYGAVQAAIDACGRKGGTVLFPAGKYYLGEPGGGGLKLPAGNKKPLVLSGYGALIKLSAHVPRFLDFDRTADYQTFAHFRVRGFAIDAGNVGGVNHVIGFTCVDQTAMSRINVRDIVVRDVRAFHIRTDTSSPHRSVRQGICIAVNQWQPYEARKNTIRDIVVDNVRLEGGTHGFSVGGLDYGVKGLWPRKPGEVNIEIDNVRLRDCSWDSGVRTSSGWVGDGMIMGGAASCGSLYVSGCDFRGSGDNNYEVNGWRYALISDCVSQDAAFCGYFFGNHGWPLGGAAGQRIIWRRCTHRQVTAMPASNGWVAGTPSTVRPMGALTLDGCFMESTVPNTGGAGFVDMTRRVAVKSISIRDCDYRATGMRPPGDTWPFILNLRCDGSPEGGPSLVSIENTSMYFRSTNTAGVAYAARLVDLSGDLAWSIRGSRFDASIEDGHSQDLRLLSLGDSAATTGSGVVDGCVFVAQALTPIGVVVGDSSTLTIDGVVTVKDCDFRGVASGIPVDLPVRDQNAGKVLLVDNVY